MDRTTDRETDRQTDRPHELHVYVRLAQARPNYMHVLQLLVMLFCSLGQNPDLLMVPCGHQTCVFNTVHTVFMHDSAINSILMIVRTFSIIELMYKNILELRTSKNRNYFVTLLYNEFQTNSFLV